MSTYIIGKCNTCNRTVPLKDGVCKDCQVKEMPDFLKDILKGFKK